MTQRLALVALILTGCEGETSVLDHDRSDDAGLPPLSLSGLSPLEGDVVGGTELRLSGSGFTETMEVVVGEVSLLLSQKGQLTLAFYARAGSEG